MQRDEGRWIDAAEPEERSLGDEMKTLGKG